MVNLKLPQSARYCAGKMATKIKKKKFCTKKTFTKNFINYYISAESRFHFH